MTDLETEVENVFRQYYTSLCLYASHYLHDTVLAEDIVQDCFTELLERISAYKKVSSIKAYLYMMVKNHCYNISKKEDLINSSSLLSNFADTMLDEESEEELQIKAKLWYAIDSLPEQCREILILSKLKGLKYKEIAEIFNISSISVKYEISKALRMLRQHPLL